MIARMPGHLLLQWLEDKSCVSRLILPEEQEEALEYVKLLLITLDISGTGEMSEVPDFWGVQDDVYCAVSSALFMPDAQQ